MYVAIWSKHGHGIFSVLHEKNSFVFFLLFCKVNTISDLLAEAVRVESQRGITCLFLLHRLLQVRGILDRHSLDEPPLKRVKRSGCWHCAYQRKHMLVCILPCKQWSYGAQGIWTNCFFSVNLKTLKRSSHLLESQWSYIFYLNNHFARKFFHFF